MPNTQVLVVDDDPKVCRTVENVLGRDGNCVRVATDGQRCLEMLSHQSFQVLFTDLFLSSMNSLSLIRQGLRIRPGLSVVVFVTAAAVESCAEAMRLGARDYLAKPFSPERLRSSLARVLACCDDSRDRQDAQADNTLCEVIPRPEVEDSWVDLVTESPSMREIGDMVAKVAPTRVPVLIQGEAGVGMDRVAWAIHRQSQRASRPFIYVSCAAIREDDLAQRLFGQERSGRGDGLLECADGGTLFLEDVDRLPLWAQARLLEVIRKGRHLGDSGWSVQPLNVRLIAATTCDLEAAMHESRFDSGLYYYLNVISISIPPLRYRPQDIRSLVERFLARAARMHEHEDGAFQWHLSQETWDALLSYPWPGNLRELISVVSRAVLLGDDGEIRRAILEQRLRPLPCQGSGEAITIPLTGDLAHIERSIVEEVIQRCHGNKAAAARSLGLHRRTLYRLLQERPR